MMIIARIILCIALVFTALSLACAVRLALRRQPKIGWRAPRQSGHFGGPSSQVKRANSAPADPDYSEDVYEPCGFAPASRTGFTAEQLRRIAPPVVTRDPLRRSFAPRSISISESGPALRPDAGGGRHFFPSGLAAARNFLRDPFGSSKFWRGKP